MNKLNKIILLCTFVLYSRVLYGMNIFAACRVGDLERVQYLISAIPIEQRKEFVNQKNRFNITLLHVAARNDRKKVVQALIAAGADVDPVLAVCGQRLGEDVVEIEQPVAAHAGILVQGPVPG